VTSSKSQEASRRNGRKGRGPKSAEGLRRSSQNARVHGLNVPVSADPELSSRAERLARLIAGPDANDAHLHEARVIAEAQMELQRVRRLRLERLAHPSLVKKRLTRTGLRTLIKLVEASIPDEWDQMHIVDKAVEDLLPEVEPQLQEKIGEVVASFKKLDRYEKRALSRRKSAMRRFQQCE